MAATIAALGGPADGSVFNIGGGRKIKLFECIVILAGHLGVEPVVEDREARRGDQRPSAAHITRVRAV